MDDSQLATKAKIHRDDQIDLDHDLGEPPQPSFPRQPMVRSQADTKIRVSRPLMTKKPPAPTQPANRPKQQRSLPIFLRMLNKCQERCRCYQIIHNRSYNFSDTTNYEEHLKSNSTLVSWTAKCDKLCCRRADSHSLSFTCFRTVKDNTQMI